MEASSRSQDNLDSPSKGLEVKAKQKDKAEERRRGELRDVERQEQESIKSSLEFTMPIAIDQAGYEDEAEDEAAVPPNPDHCT